MGPEVKLAITRHVTSERVAAALRRPQFEASASVGKRSLPIVESARSCNTDRRFAQRRQPADGRVRNARRHGRIAGTRVGAPNPRLPRFCAACGNKIVLVPTASRTLWPSGLRRWLKAPVRKGVGSNPTGVMHAVGQLTSHARMHSQHVSILVHATWLLRILRRRTPPRAGSSVQNSSGPRTPIHFRISVHSISVCMCKCPLSTWEC